MALHIYGIVVFNQDLMIDKKSNTKISIKDKEISKMIDELEIKIIEDI